MKKTILLSIAALALVSCAKEMRTPGTNSRNQRQVTIIASMDDEASDPDSRTTVDGVGVYSWQGSEKISLVEEDYDSNGGIDFTLADAETGAFSGTLTAGKAPVFAVSPKGILGDAAEDSGVMMYDITLPNSYSNYVPGTTNAVMIGAPNGKSGDNYKFIFRQAAALLKFTYVNVPVGTKKFVFSNTNNFVTGTWSGLDASTGVSLSENDTNFSEDGATVSLDLATKVYEANTTLDFYIPVPVSTYKDFAIELQDKDGNLIAGTNKSKDGLTIPLAAGDIFPCPTINLAAATKGAIWNPALTAAGNLSKSGATLGGLNVISSVDAGSFESSGNARGCQFSSGADPTVTIPYTDYVESVVVVCSANNSLSSVAVTVDDIALGAVQAMSNGVANETHTFKVATNGRFRKGNVKVIVTNDKSDKTTWIKSITINGDVREDAGLAYAKTAVAKATDAANFTNPLTNPNSLEGITYASSNTDVATVNSTTGEVIVKAAGETTITASFAGNEFYKAGNASYTLTVAAAYLTLPGATTPAKADCVDDATVSFNIDSNIDWTAAKGTDVNSIIKSVSFNASTVTVTFNANAGAEKTALVTITPVEEGYRATLTKNMTVTQKKFEKVDVLTQSWTGIGTGKTGYAAWSDKGGSVSDAVYAGQSYDGDYLQIRATSPSGIVSTTSGGALTKVVVTYAGTNVNGRKLSIFGKNSAYSGTSGLYDEEEKGTLIGTITFTTGDATGYLEIASYYEFVGIWSGEGAMYFSEIDVHWDNPKAANGLAWSKASDTGTITSSGNTLPTATLSNPNSLSVSYSSSDTGVATINPSTGVISLVAAGSTNIIATTPGDATYKPGSVRYTLTVSDTREACATPSFSPVAGEVSVNTVVTISSATTGSTIYYTTNGDTPTVGGATTTAGSAGAASATVTIDADKTIKAIAVKEPSNKPSAVATAAYTAAGASKTVVFTPASKNTVSISGDKTGITATYSNSYNNTNQMTGGNSCTLTISGLGSKTITAISINARNNKSSGSGTLTIVTGTTNIIDSYTLTGLGNAYTDIPLTVKNGSVASEASVVMSIDCTESSTFFGSLSITYE